MKKIVLVIGLILFLSSNTLSQWQLVNPLPFEENINSSFFINRYIGWVACNHGEIYKTTDGGSNWIHQNSGTVNGLSSIFFVNENVGFITGWNGIILKTVNGGDNWEINANNLAYYLNSIYFADELTGWVVGYDGKIFRTTNGGDDWYPRGSGVTSALSEVKFFNKSLGWVVGWNNGNSGNKILKTTNGGISWSTVYSDFTDYFLYTLTFIDSLKGFAAGKGGKILSTTDGGQNWNQIYQTSSSIDWFNSIYFSDSLNGWAVGGFHNLIVHTSNGGLNWIEINTGISDPLFDSNNDVSFASDSIGWVFASGRAFYKTTDCGTSWINQSKDFLRADFHSIDFFNSNLGFGIGDRNSIFKTEDGGLNWTTTYCNARSVNKIKFIDENIGYIAGTKSENIPGYDLYDGLLLKTTNSGNEWVENYVGGMTTEFKDICFVSDTLGWFTGTLPAGIAYKTSDGGNTWDLQGIEYNDYSINSVDFIDENFGIAAGTRFYKTTSGGENWELSPFIPATQIKSIILLDNYVGFAIGNGIDALYKTIDGGNSWIEMHTGSNEYLQKITFVNDTIGYTISTSEVYKTTDQGSTWIKQQSPYHWGLSDLSFTNPNEGYVVGYKGYISKTTNGGVTFIDEEKNQTHPKQYLLSQNYPNPFNPSTKISYQLPNAGYLTLKVFDVLGREVKTLVDEYKSAGNYEIDFNATNLPSGIYFYQLKTGEFVETKKMILLQ
jgi:photosystem II stability/assembly factor-like uncharacterized protein